MVLSLRVLRGSGPYRYAGGLGLEFAELVEDVLGLVPCGARGFVVADGVMGVSEAA